MTVFIIHCFSKKVKGFWKTPRQKEKEQTMCIELSYTAPSFEVKACSAIILAHCMQKINT